MRKGQRPWQRTLTFWWGWQPRNQLSHHPSGVTGSDGAGTLCYTVWSGKPSLRRDVWTETPNKLRERAMGPLGREVQVKGTECTEALRLKCAWLAHSSAPPPLSKTNFWSFNSLLSPICPTPERGLDKRLKGTAGNEELEGRVEKQGSKANIHKTGSPAATVSSARPGRGLQALGAAPAGVRAHLTLPCPLLFAGSERWEGRQAWRTAWTYLKRQQGVERGGLWKQTDFQTVCGP